MAERVRDRVRRLLQDDPSLEIHYTDAIRLDSYFQSTRNGRPALFLHSSHQSFVDELRGIKDSP